jgi:hypothetical protein
MPDEKKGSAYFIIGKFLFHSLPGIGREIPPYPLKHSMIRLYRAEISSRGAEQKLLIGTTFPEL